MSSRQITFESIEALTHARTTADVLAALRKLANVIGFESFCIAGIPEPGETLAPYVMLSGWPTGWLDRYTQHDYIRVDPVIAALKAGSMPFEWRDASYEKGRGSRPAAVMGEAQEFGLVEGVSVPIHSAGGFRAAVSFGARRLRPTARQKMALHLVAIYAHEQLREILGRNGGVRTADVVPLSPREAECLRWAADGKTSWETSVILSLSESTVESYLRTATRKLGAANRTQAVARALRRGIIS